MRPEYRKPHVGDKVQIVADTADENLTRVKNEYPDKFVSPDTVFNCVRPGARIFVGTGCAEPQFLIRSLVAYVESHPKAFFDAELVQVVALGVAPYAASEFKANFRCNAFFIGGSMRSGINLGLADYTPVFLSEVPGLISRGQLPIDIALIQTSPPDAHGYMSLGVSVDIAKAAVEKASKAIGGKWPNTEQVADALRGIEVESLGGKVTYRTDQIPECNFYAGFTTHKNDFEFCTIDRINTMHSRELQKPAGADFFKWIETMNWKI